MKTFNFLTVFLLLVLSQASAQMKYNMYFNGDITNWMDREEIRDSGFTSATVMELRKDNLWDTSYTYAFKGNEIVHERKYIGGVLILDILTKIKDGKKIQYTTETYPNLEPELIVEEYDSLGLPRVATNYYNGEINFWTRHNYEGNVLISTERGHKGGDTAFEKLSYNSFGDLIKIIEHSSSLRVTDSILIHITYNEKGNKLLYYKRPSPTYMKNMQQWCGTGLVETYRNEYDSLGRLARKILDYDTLVTPDQSRNYIRYSYGENGVLMTRYSGSTEEYVLQSNKRVDDSRFMTDGDDAMRITYLSPESEIPVRFDLLSNTLQKTYRVVWTR